MTLLFGHYVDTYLMQIIKGINRAAKFFELPTTDQYFPTYSLVHSRKKKKKLRGKKCCVPHFFFVFHFSNSQQTRLRILLPDIINNNGLRAIRIRDW